MQAGGQGCCGQPACPKRAQDKSRTGETRLKLLETKKGSLGRTISTNLLPLNKKTSNPRQNSQAGRRRFDPAASNPKSTTPKVTFATMKSSVDCLSFSLSVYLGGTERYVIRAGRRNPGKLDSAFAGKKRERTFRTNGVHILSKAPA